MRSAIIAAAFAAGAIAVPHQKRDVITDYDVVYVTDVVTVTAGEESSSSSFTQAAHYGHHSYHHWSWSTATLHASSVAPTTPSSSPVKASSTSTPSPVAPTTSIKPTTSAKPTTSTKPTTSAKPSTSAAPVTTSAAPSSTTAVAASGTSTVTYTSAIPSSYSYSDIAVFHHNIHRSNHSAPDIEWDDDLASTAATIAASCVYAHNVDTNGGGYGQNIAAGVESNNISAIITDLFYNGEVGWFDGLYGEAQPSMTNFENWGHFSQIVWAGTTHVGCATQDCTSSGLANVGSDVAPYFTVCNYKSPGNYANEYGANIGAPNGDPTASWGEIYA